MRELIDITNSIAVCVYGCILSCAFCGMGETAKSRRTAIGITAVMLAIQGGALLFLGPEELRAWYPLVTHLPLVLSLWAHCGRLERAFASVVTAYLCCQLRRWLGLVAVALVGGGGMAQDVAELALTLPLLWLLLRFVAPPVGRVTGRRATAQYVFLLLPSVYYVFDYVATVYTDWLYGGISAVVEFMPFVCCATYLWYVLYISEREKDSLLLEAERNSLNLQIAQALRELSSLREAQQRTAVYRHDLRHHLQYISACIENGKLDSAQEYIQTISAEIAAQKVTAYCENETVNLMLSSYASRAAKAGVKLCVQAQLSPVLGVAAGDLCVILGNGLQNALAACAALPQERAPGCIRVLGYEKGGKVFLQISNSCAEAPVFENGLPVAKEPGHGIGTRSILAIARRYGGLCSFQVENGEFVLRLSI